MGLPAVGNTNFGLVYAGSAIAEACDVQDTADISLKNLCIGGGLDFGTGDGDACNNFDTFGGSNNPLESSAGTDTDASDLLDIGSAPYHMSHCIGGTHEPGGGPGR
jgi:hypothetical protein